MKLGKRSKRQKRRIEKDRQRERRKCVREIWGGLGVS